MDSVRCICIDDAKKPIEIPQDKWVKKDDEYHITHIFVMRNQKNIQGCELAEFDISMYAPYNCYRLSRFAILMEDLGKLAALIKRSDEFNQLSDIDIQKLVDDIPIKEKVTVENIQKSHNHDHFWVEDKILYESYNTIRGMRYRKLFLIDYPDTEILPEDFNPIKFKI